MRLAELYELAFIARGDTDVPTAVEAAGAFVRQACSRHGHAIRDGRCERCGLRIPDVAVLSAEEDRHLKEAREKSSRVLKDLGSRKDTR